MWQSWELFVLGYIVSSAQSQIDSTLTPQNVSLSWINEFGVNLSWAAPQNVMAHCGYFRWFQWIRGNKVDEGFITYDRLHMTYNLDINRVIMDGGSLNFSVQTHCPGNRTERVFRNITYPDLVKNFQCSVYSCNAANCSWSLANHVPDLQLFYKKVREHSSEEPYLQECSDYLNTTDSGRSGCHLQGVNSAHIVYFLINGTLNGRPVRNTFILDAATNVMPPKLNLTVTQEGDHLNISWTVPDLATCIPEWKFIINYTECNEEKHTTAEPPESSMHVPYSPHCPYRIAIRSSYGGRETLREEKLYGESRKRYASMYAVAVVLPLMFAVFAVLSFVCFRKYKDKIFPKVPEPRDFLRDMFNNNNDMSPMGNLYVPPQEDEEDCKIDLVLEPLPGEPHC